MSVDRILWLVSDTVRADYVGYGGGHVHTPNLDALAARSTVFDRHLCRVSGVRCQVSDVRCQVSGVRCQMSGVRCQVGNRTPIGPGRRRDC